MQERETLKQEIYRERNPKDGSPGRSIDKIKWAFEVYLTALARQEAEEEKKRDIYYRVKKRLGWL